VLAAGTGETLRNRTSIFKNNAKTVLENGAVKIWKTGARKINNKFWLFGIAALLGLGKAPAQETQTHLSKETIANVKSTSPVDSLKPAADSLFLYHADLPKFLELASELDDVDIEYVTVQSDRELLVKNGYYNPRLDKIFIRFINNPDDDYKKIMYNKRLPFVFAHEYKHLADRRNYSKYGFSRDELIKSNIHEELTARMSELLLGRKIFMLTGSIADAFIDQNADADANYRTGTMVNTYNPYANYLKKQNGKLDAIPTAAEIDVIVQAVLDMMRHEPDNQELK
jgi:hypothetical protein